MPSKSKFVFKVIVVGDGAVGKTSLILRFTEKKFHEEYKKTLGTDFAVKKINVDENEVKLQIWDLGGQEIFRNLRKVFYPGAKAAIIVYDVSNRKSFRNVVNWYDDVKETLNDIPIILVGNKIDLERVVSYNEALDLSQKLNCNYIETSAKIDRNVDEAFNNIAKEAIKSPTIEKTVKVEPSIPQSFNEKNQFEFKIPRTPTLIPPKIKIEMPESFEKPKSLPFNVTKFYEWFFNNKKRLVLMIEDLLSLTIDLEDSLREGSFKEIINFFVENNISFDYQPNKSDITAWYGEGSPILSIIVDLTENDNMESRKNIVISSLLSLLNLINSKVEISGRVYFHYLLHSKKDINENVDIFIQRISSISDYIILLSNDSIELVTIMPKILSSMKITAEPIKPDSINEYLLNSFLIRFISHTVEPKLRIFYDIKLPSSKINIRNIQLANKEYKAAISTLDFHLDIPESTKKIINILDGIKNRLKEENPNLNIIIEEVKSDLNPFIEEETYLLLAIRDIVFYNLKKIIKLRSGTENQLALRFSQTGKPIIICGSSIDKTEIFQVEVFDEILIPSKIITGVIIDIISKGYTKDI